MDSEEKGREREGATAEQPAPNQEAGQSQQDSTARTGESPISGQTAPASQPQPARPAPVSETWVEGQPASDADYNARVEKGRES